MAFRFPATFPKGLPPRLRRSGLPVLETAENQPSVKLQKNTHTPAGSVQPLDHVLHQVPGVLDVYVNPITDTAYVSYDPDRCTEAQLEEVIREAGFHVPPRR